MSVELQINGQSYLIQTNLVAFNPFFQQILHGGYFESDKKIVNLTVPFEERAISGFIRYIKDGSLKYSNLKNLIELLGVAEYFCSDELVKAVDQEFSELILTKELTEKIARFILHTPLLRIPPSIENTLAQTLKASPDLKETVNEYTPSLFLSLMKSQEIFPSTRSKMITTYLKDHDVPESILTQFEEIQ